jgi:hypothetical protein
MSDREMHGKENVSPSIIGVSMYPGTIALERTTRPLSELAASTAVERVRPSKPAFDAA